MDLLLDFKKTEIEKAITDGRWVEEVKMLRMKKLEKLNK